MPPVAFVGITTDVFLNFAPVGGSKFPFQSCREAGTASSSKTTVQNNLDNLIRCHLGKYPAKGLITIRSNIFINIFRIDHTAVTQGNPVLLFIKVCFCKGFYALICQCLIINKTFDNTAFEQVFFNDLRNIFFLYHGIENGFRINNHDRPESTQTMTSGLYNGYLFGQSLFIKFSF